MSKKKIVGLFVNLKSAMLVFFAVVIWLAFANINASVQSTPDDVLTAGNYLKQNAVVTGDTCANPIDLTLFQPTVGIMTNDVGNDYELDTSASTSCYLGAGNFTSRGIGRDRVYRFVPPQTRAYSARMSLGRTTGNVILYFSQSCPTATPGTPVQLACQNTGGTAPTAFAAANRNDTPVTETEEISCQTLTAGTPYFLFVDEQIMTTFERSYNLEVVPCNAEIEGAMPLGNGTPATASVITGNQITGSVVPTDDVDFYSLGNPVAGSRLFAILDTAASENDNAELRVTTTTGTLEYDYDSNTLPFGANGGNIAGLTLPGGVAGNVYFRVDRFGFNLVVDPYLLTYIIRPPNSQTPESEPNGTTAQSNSNTNGYFSGALSTNDDVDVYAVNVEPGTLIFASIDGDPLRDNTPFDAVLELLDADGNVLLTVDGNSASSNNTASPVTLDATTPFAPSEALTFRVPQTLVPSLAPRPYFVRVTSFNAASNDDYLLSIAQFAPPASTAAAVKIGGRVITDGGRGIGNVRVTMTTQDGSKRFALTNNFGFYSFAGVAAGQTVTLNAESKRFTFIEPTRTFQANEDNLELNFVSAKQSR